MADILIAIFFGYPAFFAGVIVGAIAAFALKKEKP